jgi:hypothetical protein
MLKSIFFAPYLTLYVSPLCVILAVQFGAGLFVWSGVAVICGTRLHYDPLVVRDVAA